MREGRRSREYFEALDEVAQALNLKLRENLQRVEENDYFRTPKAVAAMVLEEAAGKLDWAVNKLSARDLSKLRTQLARAIAGGILTSLSFTCPPKEGEISPEQIVLNFIGGR